MAMIKWIATNSVNYTVLGTKDSNSLYFLEDTQEIYKGNVPFTGSVVLCDTYPETKAAQGKIYVNNTTLEGKVWTGFEWKTVIQAVSTVLTDVDTFNTPVSGEAIKTYVSQRFTEEVTGKFIEGITFNELTKSIEYRQNSTNVTVPVDGFVTGVVYDGSTGELTFSIKGNSDVIVNIPLDNFVKTGGYDSETDAIVLTLQNGDIISIPAGDLIDVYTASDSSTVSTFIDGSKNITSNIKISLTEDNGITVKDDGLFVLNTDISNKLDLVALDKAGELIVSAVDGTVAVSGIKTGADILNVIPDATTLATEIAVDAIRLALISSINAKIDISNITLSTFIPASAADAVETKVLSEKAILTALETVRDDSVAKTDITNTVTEMGSTTNVTSEKAVVDALSWIIL